ncbi:glutathione S-transferase N-terminal domain-containing protein [Candidatus Wolfebacteria bacterium]|nr:glutathione S-transferase N-terminal domain-containing protein [Candidatus Wolfebacteria bacterium]
MIKLYSTPTCPYCEMAKNYFKEKNVEFEVYDISADEKAQKEMVEVSKQITVPVIDINGKIIIGFNRAEIDKILNL